MIVCEPVKAGNEHHQSWMRRKLFEIKWWFIHLRNHWKKSPMQSWAERVHSDDTVHYNDVDRAICVDQDDPRDVHHFSLSSKFVDELFPLTFPYMPTNKPYKVIDKIFSSEGKPGEFDTVGVIKVVTPEGEEKLVGRYYKEDGNTFAEIPKEEFDKRFETYKEMCSVKK